jgi:metal-responsive CopG/Arc/MetJ family transcriptional regulator
MTTQINIRLNENLLQEINTLAHILHVSRSEWLRMKLAQAVKEDLLKYREALAMEYTMGHISFDELQTAVGRGAEDVRMISEMTQKGKKEIDRLFSE